MAEIYQQILDDEEKFNEIVKVAFDNTDSNKTGTIDKENLRAMMNQILNDLSYEPPTNTEVDEVFDYLDSNKKGFLSFDDFKVLFRDIFKSMIEELS